MGICLVSKAPDWRVVILNKKDNVGSSWTFAQYTKRPPGNVPPLDKIGSVRYAGHECTDFGLLDIKDDGRVDPQHRYGQHYYVLDDGSAPKEAQLIVMKFFNEHSLLPGIILFDRKGDIEKQSKAIGRDLGGWLRMIAPNNITYVQTGYIEEKPYPDHYFDYPKGFKITTDFRLIDFGAAKRKQLDDIWLKDMKLGE